MENEESALSIVHTLSPLGFESLRDASVLQQQRDPVSAERWPSVQWKVSLLFTSSLSLFSISSLLCDFIHGREMKVM